MKAYVVSLALPLVAVLSLNYVMDVGNFRNREMVRELAVRQTSRELVAAPDQLDHRTWVRSRLLEAHAACPELLITGSSTVSKLAPVMFPGRRVFNAFVAGPSTEDLEALSTVLRGAACKPEWIVVGADPWWVANGALQDRRWIGWADDYLAFDGPDSASAMAVRADLLWSRFEDQLGFLSTRESLNVLLHGRSRTATILIDNTPEALDAFCGTSALPGSWVRATDGHALSCDRFNPTPKERDALAEQYAVVNPHALGEWREIDRSRIAALRRVISRWRDDGIGVLLLAPPFHPLTYKLLVHHPRIGPNLEALDSALANLGAGVRFLNARDPSTTPCSGEEFEDSHHAGASCEAKLAARIAREVGTSTAETAPNGPP